MIVIDSYGNRVTDGDKIVLEGNIPDHIKYCLCTEHLELAYFHDHKEWCFTDGAGGVAVKDVLKLKLKFRKVE